MGITASCLRLSSASYNPIVLISKVASLILLAASIKSSSGFLTLSREQEEAARKHQSHENDSCENSSGRDGYVDEVDGLGGLNRLGIGIDSLIHDATS